MNLNINLDKIHNSREKNISIKENMRDLILKTKTLVRDTNLYSEYMNNQEEKLPIIDSTRSMHSKQRSCVDSILPKISVSSLSPFASSRGYKINKSSLHKIESLNISLNKQETLTKSVIPKTINFCHLKNEKNKQIKTYFSDLDLEGYEVNTLCKINREKKQNYIKSIQSRLGNREILFEKKLRENNMIKKNKPDKFKLKIYSIKLSFFENCEQNEIDKSSPIYELFIPFYLLIFLGEIDVKSFINFICFSLYFDEENDKIMLNDKLFLDLAEKHQRSCEDNLESSYKFLWIAKEKVYQVEIKMPWVEFSFVKKDIVVKRKIERDIIVGLLLDEFNKWEYYIIDYLYSFKKFRNIFNLTLSKYNNLTDKVFYLDNPPPIQSHDNSSSYQVWITITNNRNILLTFK